MNLGRNQNKGDAIRKDSLDDWNAGNLNDADDDVGAVVQDILQIREKARRKHDFLLVDELRDELEEDYGVHVVDDVDE